MHSRHQLTDLRSYGGSWQTDNGSFAEYVRMNSAAVFKVPYGMTYEEAASFPVCIESSARYTEMGF